MFLGLACVPSFGSWFWILVVVVQFDFFFSFNISLCLQLGPILNVSAAGMSYLCGCLGPQLLGGSHNNLDFRCLLLALYGAKLTDSLRDRQLSCNDCETHTINPFF